MPRLDHHHRRDVGARAPAIRGEPLSALGAAAADAARARHRGLSCVPCFRSRRCRHRGAGVAADPDRRLRHRPAADRRGAALSPRARAGDRSQPRQPCLCAAQGGGARHRQYRIRPGRHHGVRAGAHLRSDRGERRAAPPGRPDARLVALLQWLKPGGAMRVGLYSELARARTLWLAREFVAERRLRRFGRKHPLLPAEPRRRSRDPRLRAHLRLAGLLQHQRVPRPAVPRAGAPADLAADRRVPGRAAPRVPRVRARRAGRCADTGPNFPTTPP